MPSTFNYFSPFAFSFILGISLLTFTALCRTREGKEKGRVGIRTGVRCTVTWTSPSQPVFKAHLVTGPQSSHLTLETLCRLRRSVLGSTTAETSAHKAAFRACAASKNDCGQNNLYPGRDILQEWRTLCIIQQFAVDANIKKL